MKKLTPEEKITVLFQENFELKRSIKYFLKVRQKGYMDHEQFYQKMLECDRIFRTVLTEDTYK